MGWTLFLGALLVQRFTRAGDLRFIAYVGIGLVTLGMLLPILSEFELGPSGFKIKTELHARDEEFTTFVDAEKASLYRFALLMVGDQTSATTLVEDAFADAYPVWRSFSDEQRSRYVLCRLVHLALSRSLLIRPVPSGLDLDESEPLRTARILSGLRPSLRAVLLLRHYEGMPEKDVARMLGRPAPDVSRDLDAATVTVEGDFARLEPAGVT